MSEHDALTLVDVMVRLDALEQRMQRLGARPRVCYQGVWRVELPYRIGDMVTSSGSLWIARADSTGQRPGAGPSAWQLAAKGGG